jgi:hypothetical protein
MLQYIEAKMMVQKLYAEYHIVIFMTCYDSTQIYRLIALTSIGEGTAALLCHLTRTIYIACLRSAPFLRL